MRAEQSLPFIMDVLCETWCKMAAAQHIRTSSHPQYVLLTTVAELAPIMPHIPEYLHAYVTI